MIGDFNDIIIDHNEIDFKNDKNITDVLLRHTFFQQHFHHVFYRMTPSLKNILS